MYTKLGDIFSQSPSPHLKLELEPYESITYPFSRRFRIASLLSAVGEAATEAEAFGVFAEVVEEAIFPARVPYSL